MVIVLLEYDEWKVLFWPEEVRNEVVTTTKTQLNCVLGDDAIAHCDEYPGFDRPARNIRVSLGSFK